MGLQSILSLALVCGASAAKKVCIVRSTHNFDLHLLWHAPSRNLTWHTPSLACILQCTSSHTVFALVQVEAPVEGNALVEHAMGLANDLIGACLVAGKDIAGLLMAAPRFGVDAFIFVVDLARSVPGKVVNVYNGDEAELNKMNDFCVYAASTVFCVYASVTALNLVLVMATKVIHYAAHCGLMTIPVKVLGQALPPPIMKVRNVLQREILDRIRTFSVSAWIIPLEGHNGAPSLKGATSAMATAISACMILSCAPAVHSLMKSGADKAAAEALAYTLGTALGLQYLVKLNA